MEQTTMSYAQLLEAYQALQEHVGALEGTAAVQQPAPAWGHEAPHTVRTREPVIVPEACLAGGGEMGARMRAMDWAATPLGPVATWPQSLRTAVSICLNSRHPMVLWWGRDCLLLYNDAWCPLIGLKHPTTLGRPGREVFPEVWEVIGPMHASVLATGQATWSDDGLLLLHRYGYTEEAYFTWSYSPIRDELGGVGGVFTAVTETTERVLAARQQRTLRELATRAMEARTAAEACCLAAETLASNPADLPFALFYLLDADATEAHLVGTAGLQPNTPASPCLVHVTGPDTATGWPLARVVGTHQATLVEDLVARFGPLPGGPWPVAPQAALLLPLIGPGQRPLPGLLIAGVSPRRALDEAYRGFLDQIAAQVATAMANAHAYEAERQRAETLATLDRAKTAFFSNVSHEFRTPLTLMLGPVEDILAKPEDQVLPENRELLTVVHRNGLRLQRLVNTLRRLGAGRERPRPGQHIPRVHSHGHGAPASRPDRWHAHADLDGAGCQPLRRGGAPLASRGGLPRADAARPGARAG